MERQHHKYGGKFASLQTKETEVNGVKSSPERESSSNKEKQVLEKKVAPPVQEKYLEREVTRSSREGSQESQLSLAQQEVADLKQVILQEIQSSDSNEMSQQALLSAVDRLEAVAVRLEGLAVKTGTSAPSSSAVSDVVAPYVTAFDDLVKGSVGQFLDLSNKIGGDVAKIGEIVSKAFQEQRQLLVVASKSKKPADGDLAKLLQPLSDCISAAVNFREGNRGSQFFNHLSVLSESLSALGWVSVAPTPGPFVKDMADAGMFYSNRVLKDYKGKDENHVNWVKAWSSTLSTLQSYIKENHTTGLSWNPQGGNALSVTKSGPASGGAPPPPGAPLPPPPPPPPAPTPESGDNNGGDDSRAQLFESLQKGTDITKGLKKVTDDMKTHKNPKLREGPAPYKATQQGPKPYSKPTGPVTAVKPVAKPVAADKPPVFELQNKKWAVEYQKGNKNIVIDNTELKQTVYAFKCTDSTIIVKGKVNSIILDSCKKVGIAFDDVLASLEFVNCQSVKGQVQGTMPTVSIDKTDGCMIYLSKDSLNCEIITSKSSEMNILVPKDDGDFTEFPLPEQFKTIYNGKKFVTNCTDSI
ncbi:adenylyl cyclase-associated protein 1-like isoform X1 [Mytilus galloprovincialis]|uniref:adenylyl cyclase-associated protein 1-like isoform X1 n=1 Tax=Mytilus galloprovincialis TaxID=29158 RepID=UPI003F7BAA3A